MFDVRAGSRSRRSIGWDQGALRSLVLLVFVYFAEGLRRELVLRDRLIDR